MSLSEEQSRKLAALCNRPTRYEIAVTARDGRQARVCYSVRQSFYVFFSIVDSNAAKLGTFLAQQAVHADFHRRDKIALLYGGPEKRAPCIGRICYTGRTERDAIRAGELPGI